MKLEFIREHLSRFSMLRKIFKKEKSKLIGFDVFEEPYPQTKYSNEKKQRDHWIKTCRWSIYIKKRFRKNIKKKIKNFELIKGDVLKTIPIFKNEKILKLLFLMSI